MSNVKPDRVKNYLTVSALTGIIKKKLLTPELMQIWVLGEITDLKSFVRGKHAYFSLKDGDALLNCAFFAGNNRFYNSILENGMKVFAFGSIDVYAPRGSYQLIVRQIIPAGEGEFALKIKALEERFKKEGLFDRKRPVPELPETIGLITSKHGAAIKDFLKMAKEVPYLKIIIFTALVQGEEAPATIIEGIRKLNEIEEVEVIVITRGGGSEEDLRCFFDENLVRAIYASKKPVISAVGHERDVVFTDRVADLRKATPTDAGKFFAEAYEKTLHNFKKLSLLLERRMKLWVEKNPDREKIKSFASSLMFLSESFLNSKTQRLDSLRESLERAVNKNLDGKEAKLNTLSIKIKPETLLSGFNTRKERLLKFRTILKNAMDRKIENLSGETAMLKNRLNGGMKSLLSHKTHLFKETSARLSIGLIKREVEKRNQKLAFLKDKMKNRAENVLKNKGVSLSMLAEKLNDLSPLNTVARGYAIVKDEYGKVVKSVRQVKEGDFVEISVKDGKLDCNVKKIKINPDER